MSSTANTAEETGDGGFADVITRMFKDPKFQESRDEAFGMIARGFNQIGRAVGAGWRENGGPEATMNYATRIVGTIKERLSKPSH